MKTSSIVIAAAVAMVFGLGVMLHAVRQNREAREQLAALASQGPEFRSKIARAEERLRTLRDAVTALEKHEAASVRAAVSAKEGAPSNANQAAGSGAGTARRLSTKSVIASDPERMARYARDYRESLDLTLGGLFKALNLTPEQIEKVKDMTVWREQSMMELNAVSEAEGLLIGSPGFARLETELEQTRRKKAAEVFDSVGLTARYNDLERLTYLRATVQRIGSIEMGSETPATAAQVSRAVDIIAANNQRTPPKNASRISWQVYGWSFRDWAAINWPVAEPQLQALLSPAQYSALRQFLGTQETWTAVANRNAANQIEARRLARQPGG